MPGQLRQMRLKPQRIFSMASTETRPRAWLEKWVSRNNPRQAPVSKCSLLRVLDEATFKQTSGVGGAMPRIVCVLIDDFAPGGNAHFVDAASQFRVQSVIADAACCVSQRAVALHSTGARISARRAWAGVKLLGRCPCAAAASIETAVSLRVETAAGVQKTLIPRPGGPSGCSGGSSSWHSSDRPPCRCARPACRAQARPW